MLHTLKLQRKYADRIIDGQKTFEVRLNDRDYQVGDLIIFNVIDSDNPDEPVTHKINDKEYEITYVHTNYGMDRGNYKYDYVILGIKPINCLG